MKIRIVLFVSLFSFLAIPMAFAVQVNSIYQAGIPVASQSAQEKPQAEQRALGQVLAKVSGNSHILDNIKVKSSLTKADSLAQEFSYSLSPSTPATPYLLNTRFDAEGVNRILRNAAVPIWGQNRPLILTWMEYESPNTSAMIIDNDSTTGLSALLKRQANLHGLPLILPTMDMEDLNKVNVNDIAMMATPTLQQASKRYASDATLVVRLFKLQNGYSVQSKMAMGLNQWNWDITGKNQEDVLATLLDNVTNTLAGKYATVISDAVQAQLTLTVTGVSQQEDLSQLMQYLMHLTPVADAEPINIIGSQVALKISLRGSKDAFVQALSVGQRLQPSAESKENNLEYQWNP